MKVIICVNATSQGLESLKAVGKYFQKNPIENADFELVHVFETIVYVNGLSAVVYPPSQDFPAIFESIGLSMKKKLEELKHDCPGLSKAKLTCLESSRPKEKILEYMNEKGAGLAVVVTHGYTGLKDIFHSSFADFLVRRAPCPVLVLRNT